jgi:hypothetical protein
VAGSVPRPAVSLAGFGFGCSVSLPGSAEHRTWIHWSIGKPALSRADDLRPRCGKGRLPAPRATSLPDRRPPLCGRFGKANEAASPRSPRPRRDAASGLSPCTCTRPGLRVGHGLEDLDTARWNTCAAMYSVAAAVRRRTRRIGIEFRTSDGRLVGSAMHRGVIYPLSLAATPSRSAHFPRQLRS